MAAVYLCDRHPDQRALAHYTLDVGQSTTPLADAPPGERIEEIENEEYPFDLCPRCTMEAMISLATRLSFAERRLWLQEFLVLKGPDQPAPVTAKRPRRVRPRKGA